MALSPDAVTAISGCRTATNSVSKAIILPFVGRSVIGERGVYVLSVGKTLQGQYNEGEVYIDANLRIISVEEGGVKVILPGIIDAVVAGFDLIGNNAWQFPRGVKTQSVFLLRRSYQEVVEQMPMARCWSYRLRMCNYMGQSDISDAFHNTRTVDQRDKMRLLLLSVLNIGNQSR